MMLLIDSSVKVALLIAMALAIGRLWRPAAAARHWLLTVAIGCAGGAPLADAWSRPPGQSRCSGWRRRHRMKREGAAVTTTIITQNADRINQAGRGACESRRGVDREDGARCSVVTIWIAGALATAVGAGRRPDPAQANFRRRASPSTADPWVRDTPPRLAPPSACDVPSSCCRAIIQRCS